MSLKKLFLLFIILGMTTSLLGQGVRILEIRAGHFNPKGTDDGLILGGSYGVCFDETVNLSLGFDFFHKNYIKETAVADTDYVSGVHETTVMKELEYSTTLMPISAEVVIRQAFNPPLHWYAGASLTYQLLFNTENNFEAGVKEKRNYNGFGWIARLGIEYTIGSRSAIILEAFYNNCKVKGNKDKVQGLPVWSQVDVSGLGIRGGLRLEFF